MAGQKALCCCFLTLALAVSGVRAATLKDVRRAGAFSICVSANQLPYSAETGPLRGFYIDIAGAIAKRLGVRLKTIWVPSREEVRHTRCDAVMGSVELTTHRRCKSGISQSKSYQTLSVPYVRVRSLLVVRDSHAAIHSLSDLASGHVAVPSGSVADMVMNENNIPVWVRFRTDNEIIRAVAEGKADAGVVSNLGYGWYRKRHPHSRIKAVQGFTIDPRLNFNAGVALRHANGALVTAVNKTLLELMRNGQMHAIFSRYGIAYTPPSRAPESGRDCAGAHP